LEFDFFCGCKENWKKYFFIFCPPHNLKSYPSDKHIDTQNQIEKRIKDLLNDSRYTINWYTLYDK